MIGAGEIRKDEGQIRFSLSVLKSTQLRPKLKLGDANPAPSFTRNGINLSGSQVLVGSLSALRTVSLLLWAVTWLWLLE
jgi:hypothetical protein